MNYSSMHRFALAAVIAGVLGLSGFTIEVKADWNEGDPHKMHYPQLPDLSPTGLNVLATFGGIWFDPLQEAYVPLGNKILADDFLCTQTGPITDIHIWGSWLNDNRDPNPMFHLSIHADIPATPEPGGYSRPGALLWQMDLHPTQQRLYANAPEQFYDPNSGRILGLDNEVWQYNFMIPEPEAFLQQEGTIYWLDVQYFNPLQPITEQLFGWKTSLDHWNDDAVYGDNDVPGGEPFPGWNELIYPEGHPMHPQSIDLAFVITIPEPRMMALAGLAALFLLNRWRRR